MAIISKPNTFSAGQTIIASQHNSNFDTIYNDYNGNITNANIASGAAIAGSKLSSLASITSAAGIIPYANIAVGSTSSMAAIEFVIDGGGSVITAGSKGFLEVPFACTITAFTAVANTTGSITVDIKKCTYAAFPTTASIISGGTTITAGVSTQNTILTNWATGTSAGSILEFYASGCTNFTRVTASLKVVKL